MRVPWTVSVVLTSMPDQVERPMQLIPVFNSNIWFETIKMYENKHYAEQYD